VVQASPALYRRIRRPAHLRCLGLLFAAAATIAGGEHGAAPARGGDRGGRVERWQPDALLQYRQQRRQVAGVARGQVQTTQLQARLEAQALREAW
jgi:hypothetical protein